MNLIFNSPVYPIPPSFTNEELEIESTKKYIDYLYANGVKHIMSTAGTTQFNLLNIDEIRIFNKTISEFKGNKIIGLPALSLLNLKNEIYHLNNEKLDDAYIMILFPERYYNDETIFEFVKEVCAISKYPLLLHGMPFKYGNGGVYNYSYSLLNKLSEIQNFIGIKEESQTIDFAKNNINSLNLEIIVAGGSMGRYWSLEPYGATSLLTGVGSFYPSIEEKFFKAYKEQNFDLAKSIINKHEIPLFKIFMKIGWHASMRHALNYLGFIKQNRAPFYALTNNEKLEIENILNQINE